MTNKFYFIFLIIFCNSKQIYCQWIDPPFTSGEDGRVTIGVLNGETQQIFIEENIEGQIVVAKLTYTDDAEPTFVFTKPENGDLSVGLSFNHLGPGLDWEMLVEKPLDYEDIRLDSFKQYRFDVTAGGRTIEVFLKIKNLDDNRPTIQVLSNPCTIPENFPEGSGWEDVDCSFQVSDPDGWISEMTYTVLGSGSEDTLFQFRNTEGIMDNTTTEWNLILSTKSLDFEQTSLYIFELLVEDSGTNNYTAKIVIEVGDVSDEAPTWRKIFPSQQFPEDTEQSFDVLAVDGDIKVNNKIRYRMQTEYTNYFQINPTSGTITIKPIDRDLEKNQIYSFTIIAYEVINPKSMIAQSVTIIIDDVNDNSPTITPAADFHIEFNENTVMTLDFGYNIVIDDIDLGENAMYTVSVRDIIPGNNFTAPFQVIPSKGYQKWNFQISITDASLLDYEDEAWRHFSFELFVQEDADSSHTDVRIIFVDLININDELPIFSQSEYVVELLESIGIGDKVATVLATDKDFGDSVKHTLLGNSGNSFVIDEITGEITTKIDNALDYERQNQIIVQIQAQDTLDLPIHTVVAQLTINVMDVNDETPRIIVPLQKIEILENLLPESEIVTEFPITATDEDTTAQLEFSIDWLGSTATKNGQFVNPTDFHGCLVAATKPNVAGNGGNVELTLSVGTKPDFETYDTLNILLKVVDTDQLSTPTKPNFSTALITIFILDQNDNTPEFDEDTINSFKSVVENSDSLTVIASIVATDKDGPEYNKVTYSLTPINDTKTGLVKIDPIYGRLFVFLNKAINADKDTSTGTPTDILYYEVTASDGTNKNTKPITIKVIDVNDNIPKHLNEPEPIEIFENTANGAFIQQIEATDFDRDDPYNRLRFAFSSGLSEDVRKFFSIDADTGIVSVNFKEEGLELDRDHGLSKFTFAYTVTDNYAGTGGTYSLDGSFTITLKDVNDERPIITTSALSTIETLLKDGLVGKVEATDKDEEGTLFSKINFAIMGITQGDGATLIPPNDLFKIDADLGNLYTNYNLEGYYGTYDVQIQTHDFGEPPQTDSKTVSVIVQKYNFKPPTFIYPTEGNNLYLLLDQAVDTVLTQYNRQPLEPFNATDNQGEKWDIELSVDTATQNFFYLKDYGRSRANLMLHSIPDLSKPYTLKLLANDKGNPPYETTININIKFIDINAEPSYIITDKEVDFSEGPSDVGTVRDLPEAVYTDDVSVIIPVFYHLHEGPGDLFQVEVDSGDLRLIGELNWEVQKEYVIKIVASKSSTGNNNPDPSSILTVTVKVTNINDNSPKFDTSKAFAGISTTTTVNQNILQLLATDLDEDTLLYTMHNDSLVANGNNLQTDNPFTFNENSGTVILNFPVQPTMSGYYTFRVSVTDGTFDDSMVVKIYIIADINKLKLQYENNLQTVVDKQDMIILVLQQEFPYSCNIDETKQVVDSNGQASTTETNAIVYFIDTTINEAVNSSIIQDQVNNVQVFARLRSAFLVHSLYLLFIGDDPTTTQNIEELLKIWLIAVSLVLGILCIILIIAFFIRNRMLSTRLNKLTATKFGSQESGLNRMGVTAPTTNKHAVEGSNPVYSDEKKTPEFDETSFASSGDSDLIGIEDSPEFDYPTEERRASFNPVIRDAMEKNNYSFAPGHNPKDTF